MLRLNILVLLVFLLAGVSLRADEKPDGDTTDVCDGRSFVKLYFNYPKQANQRMFGGMGGGMGMGMGGMGASPKPEVVKLFLDQQFVGNAIPLVYGIKPELRVVAGLHTLRVECDGYETFNAQLEVIGGGSTQWIVVDMKRNAKQLTESASVMRFLILANRADHQSLIQLATSRANSGLPESGSRDVRDQRGACVGRWVTVARRDEMEGNTRPLYVNVSDGTIRNAATGKIIALPAEVREQNAELAIAQWMDKQGIESLEVLVVIDPILDVASRDLASVASTFDENGNPAIAFTLTDTGSGRFFALTTSNAPVGSRTRQLGIVLDDSLISAPNIRSPIRKEGRITGRFARAEVELIVRKLKVQTAAGRVAK